MSVWTTPTTRSTGLLVTAPIWNTDIVNNLLYLKTAPVFDTAVIIGAATTAGVRLDLESGTLAVREGDDSAYAPLITSVVNLPSGGSINFASGDVTITHATNQLTFAGATSGYVFNDGNLFVRSSATTGSYAWGTGQIKAEQDTFTGLSCVTHDNADGNAGFVQILRSRGTQASPTAVTSSQFIGSYNWSGYDGVNAGYRTVAEIQAYVDGTVSAGVVPGSLRFAVANSGGTLVERMRISASGDIGIGVVPAASSMFWNTLRLFQPGNSILSAGNTLSLGLNIVYGVPTYADSLPATDYTQTNGIHSFSTAPSGVAGNTITLTERFRILNGGNIGIGATARLYLDGVAGTGDTYIAETSANILRLYAGGTDVVICQSDGLYLGIMPTTATAANMVYNTGTARVERSTSSLRYKHDIATLDGSDALAAVMAMRPITYRGKTDADQRRYVGFIAEEMQQWAPLLCTYDDGGESGTPNYVTYDRVTAYLVAVVQQQQTEINALKARIH